VYLVDARRRQRAGQIRDEWRRRAPSRRRQERKTEERVSEKGKGGKKQREPEALSREGGGLSMSQAPASLPPQAGVR
jgi:hypothetical protein